MPRELILELKAAGFPNIHVHCIKGRDGEHACRADKPDCNIQFLHTPTLEELIEACGDYYHLLKKEYAKNKWLAVGNKNKPDEFEYCSGSTPSEAVARLWLALTQEKI